MTTVELTPDQTRAICRGLGSTLVDLISSLAGQASYDPCMAIEPHHGELAMLETGAKLYWSDERGCAILSGYAQDGSDVDPYLDTCLVQS